MVTHTLFGLSNFLGATNSDRDYDYTKLYSAPDKLEDGIKDNARVWNVYLDEAENYDVEMIQGFHSRIDSLVVFSSLFSAVFTTFVAQTSQALQPDKTQIIIALLSENNQLLRAGGNRNTISAVPGTSTGLEGRSYTSIDIWVNGLFFISLALSLSTALLSALAKQWLRAYTMDVPGSAKKRALIRHFRFQGLEKWRLAEIIETLPLIFQTSVVTFLVGLVLYASQLSSLICGIISGIIALTFLFYLGTSIIPAFDIACPYRIPCLFLAQPLVFAFRVARYYVARYAFPSPGSKDFPKMSQWSFEIEESYRYQNHKSNDLTWNSLEWMFNLSPNHSVKYVVVEGACSLLNDSWKSTGYIDPLFPISSSSSKLFPSVVEYSFSHLSDTILTSEEDDLKSNPYINLVEIIKPFASRYNREHGFLILLLDAYRSVINKKYRALSRRVLDWDHGMTSQFGHEVLKYCAMYGDDEGIHDLMDRGIDLKLRDPENNYTALHWAAQKGNLQGVIALLQQEPSLISAVAKSNSDHSFPFKTFTALDLAVMFGHTHVVTHLLDAGAEPPSHALHIAVLSRDMDSTQCLAVVELLLNRGWDSKLKDAKGRTPVDIARNEGRDAVKVILENYQTVGRYPPPCPAASLTLENDDRE